RLDGRSEAAVVAATAELVKDRTAVIVAHRPAMIDLADRVIRIHDGRVISDTSRRPEPASADGPVSVSLEGRGERWRGRCGCGWCTRCWPGRRPTWRGSG